MSVIRRIQFSKNDLFFLSLSFESGADERCWECCSKAIEMCPSNPEAHQLMASCLLSQQHQEKAKEALMKGLALWLPSYHGKGEVEREGEDEEMNEAGPVSEKEVEWILALGNQLMLTCTFLSSRFANFLHMYREFLLPNCYLSLKNMM